MHSPESHVFLLLDLQRKCFLKKKFTKLNFYFILPLFIWPEMY
uniref:Uncharacterized protein n=1 Tax=Anguilla anguilla TaxID=7936 RepID=A0A0E9VDR9_ANGAN